MTTATAQRDPLVDELLAVLDETIDLQRETLEQLRALSKAILARDDKTLGQRMDDLGRTPPRLDAVARRRNALRSRLARALGCPVGEMTLERLAREVPEPQAAAVRLRRARLRDLAEAVRMQHLETAVLVAEVARVNRSLLLGLCPGAGETGTYRTDGTALWQPGHGLLDARR
ncbi:MAG: hypothetical protein AMS14_02645 [Planctomycetes bacterium DG_20]|nr:MAG: hypothetical protein AMS14_02645 [Planctomycetes bacterium DG_20]